MKRVDNDPNQAGSSQQSSSDNVQSGRGTINSVQHQQKRTKTNYEEDKLENSNPKKQKTSSTGRQSMEVDHYSASRKRSHEDEENALQVKRLRLSTCSNLQQSSDIQKNRKPTGLLTYYHGIAYQMQWTMVLALEAQDRLSGKKKWC